MSRERALTLLGSGLSPTVVASALGVTESYISQLLSEEEFAIQVTQLRYESLAKHNARDAELDKLEDKLIEKMHNLLPLMIRPMEVIRAFSIINAAKRRGASTPQQITEQQTLVNLNIPITVENKFVVTSDNQVVEVNSQTLLPMQSSNVQKLLENVRKKYETSRPPARLNEAVKNL